MYVYTTVSVGHRLQAAPEQGGVRASPLWHLWIRCDSPEEVLVANTHSSWGCDALD